MNERTAKIALGTTVVVLGGLGLWKWRNAQRDQKASTIFTRLQQLLDDASGQLQWEKAFDVGYPRTLPKRSNQSLLVLKPQVALRYANKIHSAWGSWYQGGDDEAKVYGVFRSLTDKVQISQVSKAYQGTYGKHLIEVIKQRFSQDEIKMLLQIIKSKPNSSYG